MTIESSAATPSQFLEAKHPDAKVWSADVDGASVAYATWVGKTLRVTSAVLSRSSKLYELACSSDDLETTDAVCAAVLKSFRLAPEGLPGE